MLETVATTVWIPFLLTTTLQTCYFYYYHFTERTGCCEVTQPYEANGIHMQASKPKWVAGPWGC